MEGGCKSNNLGMFFICAKFFKMTCFDVFFKNNNPDYSILSSNFLSSGTDKFVKNRSMTPEGKATYLKL